MKTTSLLRRCAVCAALAALPFTLAAATLPAATLPDAADDHAAQLLARDGLVPVRSVGDYVQPGTFRVQVAAKLGRPDLVLADGTWLYHGRRIDQSGAAGTLVVRFAAKGRVQSLAIATPAVVAALQKDPRAPADNMLLATK